MGVSTGLDKQERCGYDVAKEVRKDCCEIIGKELSFIVSGRMYDDIFLNPDQLRRENIDRCVEKIREKLLAFALANDWN